MFGTAMAKLHEDPALIEAIRVLAIEESPLWEVSQEVASHSPGLGEPDRHAAAVQAVSQLLSQGLIELVWTRWTATDAVWRVASADEIEAILNSPQYWHEATRYEDHVEIHAAGAIPSSPVAR